MAGLCLAAAWNCWGLGLLQLLARHHVVGHGGMQGAASSGYAWDMLLAAWLTAVCWFAFKMGGTAQQCRQLHLRALLLAGMGLTASCEALMQDISSCCLLQSNASEVQQQCGRQIQT